MRKLFVVMGLIALVAIIGCGNKTDEGELQDAENLVQGLGTLALMTNVDAYSGYNGSKPGLCTPPLGWSGPDTVEVPEGTNDQYYKFFVKWTLDSMGTFVDSFAWYVMLTPDVWGADSDTVASSIDTWLLCDTRNIWFHTLITIPDTLHISGSMKWNWEATWYSYGFLNMSVTDESGEINITTSTNIGLSAHFLFDTLGAGGPDDNWGKYQSTTFVQFTFFAEPDTSGYIGYYELLSEGWKVQHFFKLQKYES